MRSRSAALELASLTMLVMAVLLISFTWLSVKWERSLLLEEVQRGLSLASDTLQSSLRDGMMHNRRDQISGSIERVSGDTDIKQIRIIDHSGRTKLSATAGDSREKLGPGAPPCNLCHTDSENPVLVRTLVIGTRTILDGSTARAFTPILAEQGCITQACHQQDAKSGVLGVIELGLSLRESEERLAGNDIRIVVASLVAILLGGGLLWFALIYRFRRPMRDLLGGIERVASGHLGYRIPVRTSDEFGRLTESFNTMNRQLTAVQDKLIQSERLISMGRLAAGVAHEINNPLSGILSYAEDLLEESEPQDPRRKDYEVIVREALRCRQIVRGLLDFARQDEPSFVQAYPRVLIEKSLDMFVRQAAFRNIRFALDLEEDLPPIEVDPLQIEQVLVNLIINAQQAMPRGGQITIHGRNTEDRQHVEFAVEDEGTGIPAEIRTKIFDPFFSTKGGRTDGLGLSICLGIVQRHGGTIDLQSEVGRGTTFRFVLPVRQNMRTLEREAIDGETHTGSRR
jgi:two-component system NtrC family sensor kinase